MKAVIYDKNVNDKVLSDQLNNTLNNIESYNAQINLNKNQAALYLNELMYNALAAFKRDKKILATIKAPSLYNIARKINKGDSFIDIITTQAISSK